jgi:hypothetical protein
MVLEGVKIEGMVIIAFSLSKMRPRGMKARRISKPASIASRERSIVAFSCKAFNLYS